MNARCIVRARANKDLAAAMDDCREALKLTPRAPKLDSRGFVYFRLGQYDRAIADYDAALAVDQALAPSFYLRGLAKCRQGDVKGGDEDVAAAEKMYPTIADLYQRMGVALNRDRSRPAACKVPRPCALELHDGAADSNAVRPTGAMWADRRARACFLCV